MKDSDLMTNDQALIESRLAEKSDYAYFFTASLMKTSKLYPCSIESVGPSYINIEDTMALQKNSPLLKIFNQERSGACKTKC